MGRQRQQRNWFWATLTLSSISVVALVLALWELIENRFFRHLDYVTLHYLYITRGIAVSMLLAFWAAWFVLRERKEKEQQLRLSSQRYRATYGSDPPRLASLAYDAMAMAGTLGKNGNFSDAVLTRSDGFSGIDGAFRFRPDGLVERNLDIVEIRTSGFVVKDAAPKDFQPVLTN